MRSAEKAKEQTFTVDPCDQMIDSAVRAIEQTPELLNNPESLGRTARLMGHMLGDEAAQAQVFKRLLETRIELAKTKAQKEQLLALIEAIKEGSLAFAWVYSHPYVDGANGRAHRFLLAAPLSTDGTVPRPFKIIDTNDLDGDDEQESVSQDLDRFSLPFLALVNPQAGVFVEPVQGLPAIPLPAKFVEAVSAKEVSSNWGEIEVAAEGADQNYVLHADLDTTRDVRKRLEEGETVRVRQECGVATAIHNSERAHEDFVEFVSTEGLRLDDLKMPPSLMKQLRRDVKALAQGKAVSVRSIGPTGVGKTTAVFCVLREVALLTGKPAAVVRLSGAYVGSELIHKTAGNMKRGQKVATSLERRGYIPAILVDEADSLLGETDGLEHTHNREERLAFQELFSKEIPGVAVYLTMNARRKSWLPAAISRRFRKRVFPRTTRSQMAAIASHYITDAALESLCMPRQEFGIVFADMLYSEQRVVAMAHFHSGRSLPIRARDLQICSPGKTESLINAFCEDIADGEPGGLDVLEATICREFQAVELNTENLFDLTFLTCPHHDTLRIVEILT